MNSISKKITRLLVLGLIIGFGTNSFAQKQWIGKLELASLDCESKQACYNVTIRGGTEEVWALGDQNYRFFFDAANASILSVNTLLPSETYSDAQVDEVLEIVGQQQELYSPLNNIDSHLGFLDFNMIAYNKQDVAAATQISPMEFTPVAEICMEVSDEMLEEDTENTMNIYFSRFSTSGGITNQFSVITAIDQPNHTCNTDAMGYIDMTYERNTDANLAEICALISSSEEITLASNKLKISPNPYSCQTLLTYESEFLQQSKHDIVIYDANKMIVTQFDNLPKGNTQIELSKNLAAGLYFIQIQTDSKRLVSELVVIKP